MPHIQKTKIIRAIISTMPYISKEEQVLLHTGMRTTHITEMSNAEADHLIASLRATQRNDKTKAEASAERMRRNIIAMAHEMFWKLPNGKADMQRINGWCANFGYLHKPFNDYTLEELPMLVTQFKKVYQSFLNAV